MLRKPVAVLVVSGLLGGLLAANADAASKSRVLQQPVRKVPVRLYHRVLSPVKTDISKAVQCGSRDTPSEPQTCDTLYYDDGTPTSAWAYYSGGNGFGVKFAASDSTTIYGALLYFWGTDWPVPGGDSAGIRVYDNDGSGGLPGTVLYEDLSVTITRGAWNYIALSSPVSENGDGIFYIFYIQVGNYPNVPGLGIDAAISMPGTQWDLVDGSFSESDEGGDWLIRADVCYEGYDHNQEEWIVFDDHQIHYPSHIWKVHPDGSGLTQLTWGDFIDASPEIDPSGEWIVFSRFDGVQNDLYKVKIDGTCLTQLTNTPDLRESYPTWSWDGNFIVFRSIPVGGSPNQSEIMLMDKNGNNILRLTNDNYDDESPSFHPISGRIFFLSDRGGHQYEVYSMNQDGSDIQRFLPFNFDVAGDVVKWSPGGTMLLVLGMNYPSNLYIIEYPSYTIRQLTYGEDTDDADWSPDGQSIVFDVGNNNATNRLYIINEDGSNLHQIGNFYGHRPSWGCHYSIAPDLVLSQFFVSSIEDSLEVTAVVENVGMPVQNVVIRFFAQDIGSGYGDTLQIGTDQIIASLGYNGVDTVSVMWQPLYDEYILYAAVDPDNAISESNEENNTASISLSGHAPTVQGISAQYDGDPQPDVIGRFISNIELNNTFTAIVADPDSVNDIKKVKFIFDDTYVLVDTTPEDGWGVTFDVGQLQSQCLLKVIAYDHVGLPSEPYVVQLNVISMPDWMQAIFDLGGEFHFDYDLAAYVSQPGYIPSDFYSDYSIPDDVLLLGGLQNGFGGGVRLNTRIPVITDGECYFIPSTGMEAIVLGDTLLYMGSEFLDQYYTITGNLDCSTLEFTGLTISMAQPYQFLEVPLPEAEAGVNFTIGPVPLSVKFDIGGDVEAQIADAQITTDENFQFANCSITPEVIIAVDLSATVEVLMGVASVALVTHPTADMETEVTYPPPDIDLSGAFLVPWEVVGSIGWGVVQGVLHQDTLGPWTFGTDGQLILDTKIPPLLARLRMLNVPDVLPNPCIASGSSNSAVVVWIHDNDPAPGSANPDVYYSFKVGSVWSEPAPIDTSANNLFEMDPAAAFLPDGDVIAVWSANDAPANETDVNEILAAQDIFYSFWDSESQAWSPPQKLIDDDTPDGVASLACDTAGNILVVWTKILGDSVHHRNSWALYYTHWDGSEWSEPAPLPMTDSDNEADCAVTLAYGPDGEATAVWLHDADGDFNTGEDTELRCAVWDGSNWSNPLVLTDNVEKERSPFVTYDMNGNVLLVWASNDSTIDKIYFSQKDASGSWSIPTVVTETNQFLESPIIKVDNRGIAMCIWRGYKGYDGDLFYSMKDLRDPESQWTEPACLTDDSLTDWLQALAIDTDNNALYVWAKQNWTGSEPRYSEKGIYLSDGIFVGGSGIKENLSLGDLNTGSHAILPDLSIEPENIVVSDTFPDLGDTVLIEARISNIGDVVSDTVLVRILDGHPDSGGTQIGPDFEVVIEPDTFIVVNTNWIALAGIHDIYVQIDPQNEVEELDEENNLSYTTCYVVPDLFIDSTGIAFNNENPLVGDTVLISAAIYNTGSVPASDVKVVILDGSPDDSLSQVIDTCSIPQIEPGSSATVQANWLSHYGRHSIYIQVDPDNEIIEPVEDNNVAFRSIEVLPDLGIDTSSISFEVITSDSVLIMANVTNEGGVDAEDVVVHFYDGNPLSGGILIDSVFEVDIQSFSSDTVMLLWHPELGLHDVYVVLDPSDVILERDEANNKASKEILLSAQADLITEWVVINNSHPGYGDTIEVSALVKNSGFANAFNVLTRFYIVNSETTQIGGIVTPLIGFQDSVLLNIEWVVNADVADTGLYEILVKADPEDEIPELDEDNNEAVVDVAVNLPQINVYPESVTKIMPPDTFETETLLIFNTGSGELHFNLSVEESLKRSGIKEPYQVNWLSVNPESAVVQVNDTAAVLVTFNTSSLNHGVYWATLNIVSNDSINPLVHVLVSLTVDQAPLAFSLLYPPESSVVVTTDTLDWEDAIDPDQDPVFYNLFVSADPKFPESLTILVDSLTVSECPLAMIGAQIVMHGGSPRKSTLSTSARIVDTHSAGRVFENPLEVKELLRQTSAKKLSRGSEYFRTIPLDTIYYWKVEAFDTLGMSTWSHNTLCFYLLSFLPGDCNGDGEVTATDLAYLAHYLFENGPAPDPLLSGDVNGDCEVNTGDLIYLGNYLFAGGPSPVPCPNPSTEIVPKPGKSNSKRR